MEHLDFNEQVGATALRRAGASEELPIGAIFTFTAYDPDGNVKWTEEVHNIVTTVGKNFILDTVFRGSSYTAALFVGLTSGTPTVAAGDTMSSHSGWTEVTAYDESTRPSLSMAVASSGSTNNSSSLASFTISANSTTVGGAFVTTSSTKGGTTGTLLNVSAFSAADKSLDDNDTLTVQVTFSA